MSIRQKHISMSIAIWLLVFPRIIYAQEGKTESKPIINVDKENLRSVPEGQKIGELLKNTELEILEQKDKWTKVRVTGWTWTPSIKIPEGFEVEKSKASLTGYVYVTIGSGAVRRCAEKLVALTKVKDTKKIESAIEKLKMALQIVKLRMTELQLKNEELSDEASKEMANIIVENYSDIYESIEESTIAKPRETKTDADGNYEFDQIELGTYLIQSEWKTSLELDVWFVFVEIKENRKYNIDLNDNNLLSMIPKW